MQQEQPTQSAMPAESDGTMPAPFKLGYDEWGIAHYVDPIPGLEIESAHLYSEYAPHVPYLYYSDVSKNRNGGNVVYINGYKNAGRASRIQLCGLDEPPLRAPFGMQMGKGQDGQTGDPNRQNLDLTIESQALWDYLSALDKKNLDMAKKRCKRWWPNKRNLTESNVEGWYKTIVTPPAQPKEGEPKKDFKDTFRTKVVLAGPNATRVYRKVGEQPETGQWMVEPVPASMLTKGVHVVPLVDNTGLWFMAAQFGNGFQLTDVIIVPRPTRRPADFGGVGVCVVDPCAAASPASSSTADSCGPNMASQADAMDDPSIYLDGAIPIDGGAGPIAHGNSAMDVI